MIEVGSKVRVKKEMNYENTCIKNFILDPLKESKSIVIIVNGTYVKLSNCEKAFHIDWLEEAL